MAATESTSDESLRMRAKEYVDKQLAVMKKYDSAPSLSERQYRDLIDKALRPLLEASKRGNRQ